MLVYINDYILVCQCKGDVARYCSVTNTHKLVLCYLINMHTNELGALVFKMWKLEHTCSLQSAHYIVCAKTAPKHHSTAPLQTRQQVHVSCTQHFQNVFFTNL